jgi:hypothetical protein
MTKNSIRTTTCTLNPETGIAKFNITGSDYKSVRFFLGSSGLTLEFLKDFDLFQDNQYELKKPRPVACPSLYIVRSREFVEESMVKLYLGQMDNRQNLNIINIRFNLFYIEPVKINFKKSIEKILLKILKNDCYEPATK